LVADDVSWPFSLSSSGSWFCSLQVSVLAFCDGSRVVTMPGAQDHKRALDGDRGLNTGGMGAYAPAPILTPELREKILEIMQRTVKGMADEGSPYEGVLYGGFMITKDGPIVLEYNVRFGDPETQVLMPLLDSDVFEIFQACVEGRLHEEDVCWKAGAASTVVMAARGYPDTYPKGMPINGLEEAKALAPLTTVYHAGTKVDGEGRVVANGGRVLAVTGLGKDIRESLQRAYQGVKTVRFDPSHYRTDIGHRALKHPVLVLGAGGREHAIALKLAESRRVSHVYVAPGNGGTATSHEKISNVAISSEDIPRLIEFAKEKAVALVVVGPEAPLVIGAKDAFTAAGFPTFGPSAAAAQLEASKAFSKDFMARHNIPTARYRNFRSYEEAVAHVQSIDYPVVLKASGIAAGKGVLMPENKDEALKGLKEIMVDRAFGSAGDEVVVEELLIGEEVSVLAFCDGTTVVDMPGAQDHKRALDGDHGLNTGGMGAYAPAPILTKGLRKQVLEIMQRTVKGMADEGSPYEGVLYGGFMITKDGPIVLEYNVRFGDPETQVLMPLLDSDVYDVFMACAQGRLAAVPVRWKAGAASTVVMAARGYPENYPKGMPITGLMDAKALAPLVTVYHAGTKVDGEGRVVANGGRVLAVTGLGRNIRESLQRAYQGVQTVRFDPAHYRTDIGHRALRRPLRLGVLGSTRGTDMQAVIDEIEAGRLNARIVLVVSNKADAGILDRARRHGIPATNVGAKGKTREVFDGEVTTLLEDAGVELVLLIGYMRIVSAAFCQRWADRCMNVHPSLLPDFAGGMDLEVHSAVIQAGKPESGCTVHFVTEEVDGGPIVVQERTPVEPGETPESLKAKVQKLEGVAFIKAIQRFMAGEVGPDGPRA
jgi:formyltetrahydrofolate-dependent phosphoribosylglycinamide formyltransferase